MQTGIRVLVVMLGLFNVLLAQVPQLSNVQAALEQTSPEMTAIRFENKQFDINTEGGHLQGVQYFESKGKRYLVASGSSSTVGYYVVIEMGEDKNQVVHYKEVLRAPYKHAGGFQMHGTLMAIGIEDNEAKNRSKVMLFDLSEPGVTDAAPLYVIEREGNSKASTAGAVGLTFHDGQYLLAVAGWDSKEIDFYRSNHSRVKDADFKFVKIVDWKTSTADRSDWIERWWSSYQNLNLLTDAEGNIWMAGLYKDKDGNYVDLYSLSFDYELKAAHLVKTYTKQFYCVKGAHFRNGGGLYVLNPEEAIVLAVGRKIGGKNVIAWFASKRPSKKK